MRYKAGSVRLARIEAANETYRITTRDAVASLAVSIQAAGLINPPVLLPAKNKTYLVISGFRRIHACARLGWDRIDARLLAPDTAPVQCALAAIADNCSQRELNLIETSRAVNLLSDALRDDNAVVAMAGKAGLPVALSILPKLRALRRLPMSWQQGIIAGSLTLPMAERLQRLSVEDAHEVFNLFGEIHAGLNVQREILDNIEESAKREGLSITDVLRSAALLKVRTSDDRDRSYRTGRIRKLLKERRYPELSAAEERFARRSGELGLRSDMKLVPPAGFEGRDYTLTLRFRDLAQLEKQKEVIERLFQAGVLKEILD